MKITVLVENNSRIGNYFFAEPGLSFFIVESNKTVLFDTGYSNIFLKNAQKLNLDISQITDIVISHSHNDHTGGLQYLKLVNKYINFIAHPNIFDAKIQNNIFYGCPVSEEKLRSNYKLYLSKVPVPISDKLIFLGEIENNISNDVDDTAIVYISEKGLFIITGCSHSGIINIIKQAKKVTGINEVYGVLGGFHLIDKTENEIIRIAEFFKYEKIEFVAPCHCCDLRSKIILSRYLPIKEICTGDIIKIR